MTLYTYCIPVDDGAAPNPFWDYCTLVICKPVIRRVAKEGDWVAATGSRNAPGGHDFGKHLVYAMKITKSISLQEYDTWCQKNCIEKIPDINNKDYRRQVGDCIYNFAANKGPAIRKGVHHEGNRPRDLGGVNALISKDFYYFGSEPIELPEDLLPIIRNGQGHKSHSNNNYIERFVKWLETMPETHNKVNADPQIKIDFGSTGNSQSCANIRCVEDDADEKSYNEGLCD